MRTKSGVPYFVFPIFRVDDLIRSFLGAVGWCAAIYFAHEITGRPSELAAVFGATLAAGVLCMAVIRGWGLLRDASDRRFIERQQREIREEAAARLKSEESVRPS